MFSEILVPLDGSKLSENAIPVAAAVSGATGGPVRLVYVWHPDTGIEPDFQRAKGVFLEYADGLARRHRLNLAGVDFWGGDAANVILTCAREAGLVVMATRGRGGLRAAVIGSVADRVIRRTDVPIIAVPGTEPVTEFGSGPVLIALDRSPIAPRALESGRALAARLGREVILLSAYEMPGPLTVEVPYYLPELMESLATETSEYLDGVVRPGERTVAVEGPPAPAIVDTAEREDAALVVVAASGKNLPRRLAFGSTTERVLHNVKRPLLIVPTREHGPARESEPLMASTTGGG
ncbi:MAG: universal stress protein [Hyphomicrobiales bacterium]